MKKVPLKNTHFPIAVINTGFCNISSVVNALNYLELKSEIVESFTDGSQVQYSGFILPGVGAFEPAMKSIKDRNLDKLIYKLVDEDIPGLGICLGMQLMAKWSMEGGSKTQGLGLFDCGVEALRPSSSTVPHTGWSETIGTEHKNTTEIQFNTSFYYVHSFVAKSRNDNDIAAYFFHGDSKEISALSNDNILAVQFHPEKSQTPGLSLIRTFLQGN